ncbi:MAG: hypothetical protein A2909_02635 [Candidatus Tagabacteria bacterium RIFCSPLOWO2_01_FULL_39_11]|uniref:50S ribosomal protein L28 n=1 Tax=Candidatus Tagabacteria bacterium RIFCSPLOWO2_01_FULL_39_11 TaxID=1802295 RepID=A0A1G2LRF2_9BACT|nr:MAG: hypothetical protein A2909_02635 [Candidatus Tagabacteria bacterium RIFCSPLOWO2_01_FULL_39_11]
MSKICPICKKGSKMSGKRKKAMSKYNPTGKTRKFPNLQWVRIPVFKNRNEKGAPDGTPRGFLKKNSLINGKRIKICTKCLKARKFLNFKFK